MSEFVEGWTILQTLGEGSYGEVKLLENPATGSAVAMKIINFEKHPSARTEVKKEILIHSLLSHANVIKYFGQRQDEKCVYIFLEYASGGELFDIIEPDIGMPHHKAQMYFNQLISGVEYLHNKGIAHRDLKPENLLLDHNGMLKITDFGMAVMFKTENEERMLNKKCGSLPYVAPEVLLRPYHGEPADIWSCGIILVALLAGELPWDKPSNECHEYVCWKMNQFSNLSPWFKIDAVALSLIRRMLVPVPSVRYTISKIKSHRWATMTHSTDVEMMEYNESKLNFTPPRSINLQDDVRMCYSQPEGTRTVSYLTETDSKPSSSSFSQPVHVEDLLLSTQLLPSQSLSPPTNCLQKLVRRMTRFFVVLNTEETLAMLAVVFEKLGYIWKSYSDGVVTVNRIDQRKSPLTFKATILIMNGQTLLDFRLSRGCGLEFKRCFIAIKKELDSVVIKAPAILSP